MRAVPILSVLSLSLLACSAEQGALLVDKVALSDLTQGDNWLA